MGLGLTISKMIIRELGGEIGVTSVPNEGSKFTLGIPIEVVTETDPMQRKDTDNNLLHNLLTDTASHELEQLDDYVSNKYEQLHKDKHIFKIFKDSTITAPQIVPH